MPALTLSRFASSLVDLIDACLTEGEDVSDGTTRNKHADLKSRGFGGRGPWTMVVLRAIGSHWIPLPPAVYTLLDGRLA